MKNRIKQKEFQNKIMQVRHKKAHRLSFYYYGQLFDRKIKIKRPLDNGLVRAFLARAQVVFDNVEVSSNDAVF